MEKEELDKIVEFIAVAETNFNNLMARANAIFDSRAAQRYVIPDKPEEEHEN